ncbi:MULTISPECIES: DUF6602 domain-containing protein [Pectobacterium]|uniref:DUF6602 domain-containing protein n=1 Tax=Pectobacterium TaxID=122277 RepID=UPI000CD1B9A5|nr:MULTISPECIES: DUF6602 domain-containing protein [Pectobacterium]POE38575.1 hypothetical protein BV920_16455 [Pectobacterium odoriferum]GKV89356.1 hypothetical protein PEC301619_13380 [Pectobacterium carotovorum subsp. carotovorum]
MSIDIKNIAELLKAVSSQEKENIAQKKINHAPTIGEMYEGLTKDLLLDDMLIKSFPSELDLKVRSGFFYDENGVESNQIDCMLVQGEGEKLPHIDEYKYDIKNVIAIFEVKKNLFLSELKDSLRLLERTDSFFSLSKSTSSLNFPMINRSFEKITHKKAPHIDDLDELSEHDYAVYQALASDQLAPVRIAIGYEGYQTESGLRKGFIKHVSDSTTFRAFKIPSLIISDNFSIIKSNGFPYYLSVPEGDKWIIAASSNCNPLIFVLELIFDKIQQKYGIDLHLDEEVFDENTCPLLSIRKENGKWDAYEIGINSSFIKNRKPYLTWEPVPIDEDEMLLLKEVETSPIITQDDIFRLRSISNKVDDLIYKLTHAGYFVHSHNGISKGSGFHFLQLNLGNYLLFPNEMKMKLWVKTHIKPSDN